MTHKQSPKSTSPRAARKPSAKSSRKPFNAGSLTRQEIQNLVLEAKDAFKYQTAMQRIEPGTSEDEWRREMVMDCVGKEGTSKLARADWPAVKIMFLELAGKEDEAFDLRMKTGVKSYRPVDQNDTWETCAQYVALVRAKLAAHRLVSICHPKGHIHEGWFLACARQRSRKPTLTMDTLTERLDPRTLWGLLSHLGNHIAVREGRDMPERRAPRRYPKKADPGEMDTTV